MVLRRSRVRSSCLAQHQSFVSYFKCFDRNLAGLCIQSGTFPLAGPSFSKIPTKCLITSFVKQHNRTTVSLGFAVNDFLAPFPKRLVFGPASFEHDVRSEERRVGKECKSRCA